MFIIHYYDFFVKAIIYFFIRINFLKYKKPEKDLSNLHRSEVYKLIHNDGKAANGISERAPKVLAPDDFSFIV